jgi:hypothetical protein
MRGLRSPTQEGRTVDSKLQSPFGRKWNCDWKEGYLPARSVALRMSHIYMVFRAWHNVCR